MPQQTRALFLAHQNAIRGANRAQYLREWTAKTRDQKAQWVHDFLTVQDRTREEQDAQNAAAYRVAIVDTAVANGFQPQTDEIAWRQFFLQIELAVATLRVSKRSSKSLRRAWERFGQNESQHPLVDPQCQTHATNETNLAQQRKVNAAIETTRMNGIRLHPPVPADPTGAMRMPGQWLDNAWQQQTYEAHMANNIVGLAAFPAAGGGWVPWHSFGGRGGMGRACL
jgi:hypothetical protein